ncbi:MAG: DoxX family protein [Cyclobacteriaceae bacterium]
MITLSQNSPWLTWTFPKWLSYVRMLFGLALAFKGLFYLFHIANYDVMPVGQTDPLVDTMLLHIIIFAHLFGGIFIALGFKTRLMVIAQMPIVIGALFMFNSLSRLILWTPNVEFLTIITTLLLLVIFLIEGSGPLSLDSIDHKVKTK